MFNANSRRIVVLNLSRKEFLFLTTGYSGYLHELLRRHRSSKIIEPPKAIEEHNIFLNLIVSQICKSTS